MNGTELIEIELCEGVSEKIIIETLTRIGVANKKEKILYPSVYMYKNEDRLYLAHFKQLFLLRDGGYNNLSEDDFKRLNSIAYCLYNWELVNLDLDKIIPHDDKVFVLPYKEKSSWKICHKFRVFY